jgi:hypothetical protein
VVRAIVFGALLLGAIGLAFWSSTKISYPVDVGSFLFGLGVAALTGFAWMLLHGWWSTVTKPFKPMKVMLETKETPAQVNFASIFAIVKGIIVIGTLIAAIILILANS